MTTQRPSVEERERLIQHWIDDAKQQLNVESRLSDWETFLAGALEPSDDKLAPLAQDAIASLRQTRGNVASGNARSAVLSLLDMAFATCQMLSLDSDAAFALQQKLRNNRKLGPVTQKIETDDRDKQILKDFNELVSEQPPPSTDDALDRLMDRWLAKSGEKKPPSMRTICRVTETKYRGKRKR